MEGKERLDLADDLAARAIGIEDLIEKAKEGAPQAIDPIAAVGPFVGLGQQPRGQERAEELIKMDEALLAEGWDARAQGGQALTQLRKEGSVHNKYIYLLIVDSQLKIRAMKENSAPLASLEREYDRLRKSLAHIGHISQGSVLDRSTLRPPRSGYQWTRKVARRTITVALSAEQFRALNQAVENERKLWKTVQKMETISRQILFGTLPHAHRRKRLGKKVLGLI